MDIADAAVLQDVPVMEAAIKVIRENSNVDVFCNTSGVCLVCGEPVPDQRRWCSSACRDAK